MGATAAPADQAGESALAESEQLALTLDYVDEQIANLNLVRAAVAAQSARWAKGHRGETAVVAGLQSRLATPWRVLPDRAWPGTRRANIDILLVGPGGVIVIDVKSWAEASIVNGQLFRGQAEAHEEIRKVRDQADAIAEGLANWGLSPNEVVPLLVLHGHAIQPTPIDGVTVVGADFLAALIAHRGERVDVTGVAALARMIDEVAPARSSGTSPRRGSPRRARPRQTRSPQQALFDAAAVTQACRDAAERGPIEQWMVWLDPVQAPMVKREWNGPARIRGAAGTGKTVVALHRAAHLARRVQGRVLVMSFVRTLADVQANLFTQIGADVSDRVEFTSIHGWAVRYLKQSGVVFDVQGTRAEKSLYPLAWKHSNAQAVLGGLSVPASYWWDEIQYVIKGRGLASEQEYLSLARTGRRVALQESHRKAVWRLFDEYQRRLELAGICDWADVLTLACKELESRGPQGRYDAVIVDEVQDLTCMGLRIVRLLSEGAVGGLLLVGDGQQAVYPGAATLTEAGIAVTGRAVVLQRNYRNGREILQRALSLVATDLFDDLGEAQESGLRAVDFAREGGTVREECFDNAASLATALLAALRLHMDENSRGSVAIACRSNAEIREWMHLLESQGIPAMDLADYRGRATDAIKVGTFQRLKGLEFSVVFVPDIDKAVWPRQAGESEDSYRERASLQRRQLFVAMTRARDELWLATTAA